MNTIEFIRNIGQTITNDSQISAQLLHFESVFFLKPIKIGVSHERLLLATPSLLRRKKCLHRIRITGNLCFKMKGKEKHLEHGEISLEEVKTILQK